MKKLMLFLSLTVIGFSCAKKDDNNTTTTTPVTQYTYVGNQCIDQTTGIAVNVQLCQQAMNNQYSCVLTATGQVVPMANCQGQGNGMGQQCYGQYYYNQGGYQQVVTCAGANCRGYTLISQQTGQQVLCQ